MQVESSSNALLPVVAVVKSTHRQRSRSLDQRSRGGGGNSCSSDGGNRILETNNSTASIRGGGPPRDIPPMNPSSVNNNDNNSSAYDETTQGSTTIITNNQSSSSLVTNSSWIASSHVAMNARETLFVSSCGDVLVCQCRDSYGRNSNPNPKSRNNIKNNDKNGGRKNKFGLNRFSSLTRHRNNNNSQKNKNNSTAIAFRRPELHQQQKSMGPFCQDESMYEECMESCGNTYDSKKGGLLGGGPQHVGNPPAPHHDDDHHHKEADDSLEQYNPLHWQIPQGEEDESLMILPSFDHETVCGSPGRNNGGSKNKRSVQPQARHRNSLKSILERNTPPITKNCVQTQDLNGSKPNSPFNTNTNIATTTTPAFLHGIPTFLSPLSHIQITQISTHPSGAHALFISAEQLLFSAGDNTFGQCGLGFRGEFISEPTIITSVCEHGGKTIHCAAGLDYSLVVVQTKVDRVERLMQNRRSSGGGGNSNANHNNKGSGMANLGMIRTRSNISISRARSSSSSNNSYNASPPRRRNTNHNSSNSIETAPSSTSQDSTLNGTTDTATNDACSAAFSTGGEPTNPATPTKENNARFEHHYHHQMYAFGNNEYMKLGLRNPSTTGGTAGNSTSGSCNARVVSSPKRVALHANIYPTNNNHDKDEEEPSDNNQSSSTLPPKGIFAVAAGHTHSMALVCRHSKSRNKDVIECYGWGKNAKSSLGLLEQPLNNNKDNQQQQQLLNIPSDEDGGYIIAPIPTIVNCHTSSTAASLGYPKKLSLGMHCSILTTSKGRCIVFGSSNDGILGLGRGVTRADVPTEIQFPCHPTQQSTEKKSTTTPTVMIRMENVSVGAHHVLAISSTGDVYTWGCAENGRLGIGRDVVVVPVEADPADPSDMDDNVTNSNNTSSSPSIVWSPTLLTIPTTPSNYHPPKPPRNNTSSKSTTYDQTTQTQHNNRVVKACAGLDTSTFLMESGEVLSCGKNTGRLGQGEVMDDVYSPMPLFGGLQLWQQQKTEDR